jgi:tagatose-1,6-bisphosphate aldolase non-catalytic subunit AgaZ/GatZ
MADVPIADTGLMARIDRSITVAAGMATAYVLDAAREVAVAAGRPLMVIASRRQIDNMDGAGGYVGWTTPQWCAQGRAADAAGSLLLCRDHGGPYPGCAARPACGHGIRLGVAALRH